MRILIVEDDHLIRRNLRQILEHHHYVVDVAINAQKGLYQAQVESYDLLILDWMLPDGSGLDICRQLRKDNVQTPILMLTAKSQLGDKVEGLNMGVDDYLTKPFAMEELLARIKALLRRQKEKVRSPIIRIDDLVIDTNTCQVQRNNIKIILAPREYALLEYLARNLGQVIDRMTLMDHVWGETIDPLSNTVDVHIRYLREKIDDKFKKKLIQTVKNKGYMLCQN